MTLAGLRKQFIPVRGYNDCNDNGVLARAPMHVPLLVVHLLLMTPIMRTNFEALLRDSCCSWTWDGVVRDNIAAARLDFH